LFCLNSAEWETIVFWKRPDIFDGAMSFFPKKNTTDYSGLLFYLEGAQKAGCPPPQMAFRIVSIENLSTFEKNIHPSVSVPQKNHLKTCISKINPSTIPGLRSWICSGLILSSALYPLSEGRGLALSKVQ